MYVFLFLHETPHIEKFEGTISNMPIVFFLKFQPKNNQIRNFLQKVFFLHETLIELNFFLIELNY